MKLCPFCAEEIQDAAIKCKHCSEMLTSVVPNDEPFQAPADEPAQAPASSQGSAVQKVGCVCLSVLMSMTAFSFGAEQFSSYGSGAAFIVGTLFAVPTLTCLFYLSLSRHWKRGALGCIGIYLCLPVAVLVSGPPPPPQPPPEPAQTAVRGEAPLLAIFRKLAPEDERRLIDIVKAVTGGLDASPALQREFSSILVNLDAAEVQLLRDFLTGTNLEYARLFFLDAQASLAQGRAIKSQERQEYERRLEEIGLPSKGLEEYDSYMDKIVNGEPITHGNRKILYTPEMIEATLSNLETRSLEVNKLFGQ